MATTAGDARWAATAGGLQRGRRGVNMLLISASSPVLRSRTQSVRLRSAVPPAAPSSTSQQASTTHAFAATRPALHKGFSLESGSGGASQPISGTVPLWPPRAPHAQRGVLGRASEAPAGTLARGEWQSATRNCTLKRAFCNRHTELLVHGGRAGRLGSTLGGGRGPVKRGWGGVRCGVVRLAVQPRAPGIRLWGTASYRSVGGRTESDVVGRCSM